MCEHHDAHCIPGPNTAPYSRRHAVAADFNTLHGRSRTCWCNKQGLQLSCTCRQLVQQLCTQSISGTRLLGAVA